MNKFIIQGGVKLRGSIRLGGAKNASYKLMIASLSAKGESRFLNIPNIKDVEIVCKIIEKLGGQIHWAGERMCILDTSKLHSFVIPQKYGEQSRASCMFVGPLLHRFGKAQFPLPGGDKIGKRPLDRHLEGFKALGATVTYSNDLVTVQAKRLNGTQYTFKKNSHTGTENMILASVLAYGRTVLENAAQEPEVDDLIKFLNNMGANIKRIAGRKIIINGVSKLKPAIHQIMPDRNEAVTYACAALATKGDIIVENAKQELLQSFLDKLGETGGGYEIGDYGIRFYYKEPLKAVKLLTQPHPGFMTDWQPLWAVMMTQAKGISVIHEAVHNYRFQYIDDLVKMGANIKLLNPKINKPEEFYNFNIADDKPEFKHAAKISGPTKLIGSKLKVHDLRAGATLVLAALIAKGTSIIQGTEHIDRGYENLDGRLRNLGANIKRA